MPANVAKYFCDNDPECDSFGGHLVSTNQTNDGIVLRSRPSTPAYDTYIGIDKSILPNAQCHLEEGACIASHMWLVCDMDVFGGNDVYPCTGNIIRSFPLAADAIHDRCLSTPECVGFRVMKNGSSGTLFSNAVCGSPGYFALPPAPPPPSPVCN